MTRDPIIVSMPHCGTRFLKERLGLKDHVHTTANWETLTQRIRGRKIIVPLREPPAVWRSWCRRENPRMFPYANFFLGWGVLQLLDSTLSLDVIAVDLQEDERITDWRKVGDEDMSRAGWQLIKVDLRPLYRLPIIDRYYGSRDGTKSNKVQ
jgi:hypothetical protein